MLVLSFTPPCISIFRTKGYICKEEDPLGLQPVVVVPINHVLRLTGFSDKKMAEPLFGPRKSGRNNGVVILTVWS